MGSEARARLGLAALLAATLFSFEQVFATSDYAGPALLGTLLAMGIAVAARRFGIGTGFTALASGVVLLTYLAIVFRTPHTLYGLPTPAAIAGLLRAIARAYANSQVDYAPVPLRNGYVILTVAAMWIATTVGEIGTFRWRRPVVAVLAPIGLFVLLMVVGTGTAAQFFLMMFLAGLLTYWALESSHRLQGWGRWVGTWQRRSPYEPGPIGSRLARRMGASCLAAALIAPLILPTLEQGIVSWRSGRGEGAGFGGGGGTDVNLLVSLRPRLTGQTNLEFFRVRSPRATYWRLASLARFNGEDWEPYPANRPLIEPTAETEISELAEAGIQFPTGDNGSALAQHFVMAEYTGEPLPAAAHPDQIAIEEFEGRSQDDVRVHPDTGDVSLEGGVQRALDYRVLSIVPDVSRAELRSARIGSADEIYLQTGSISDRVERLLERWIRDQETPYEKLVAIQDRLRSFSYSTDLRVDDERAASADYLTTFLTETRVGFCQQFATAFAVLARRLGYPARVSVGFLPGAASTDREDEYIVRGTHAHAWPEVLFEGLGWIRFEPTPRSLSSPPTYTVPAADALGASGVGGTGGGDLLGGQGDIRANFPADVGEGGPLRGAPAGNGGRNPDVSGAWKQTFTLLVAVLLAGVILFLIAVPLAKESLVARCYRRARGPRDTVAAAFDQFVYEASQLVVPKSPAESAAAYTRRVSGLHRVPPVPAMDLARFYEAAEYGRDGIGASEAADARRIARDLRARLWKTSGWWDRAVRLFSPRGLLAR